MINEITQDASTRMGKSIEALKVEFTKLRTGRAHASLLDQVMVEYYGGEVPISQVANISVSDARMLTVTPWEKKMMPTIEKAIMKSDLGLNPSASGDLIRIAIPPLTEERRRDMTKLVRAEAEAAKVAVRNIRRDSNGDLKDLLKEKEISEDEERRAQDTVQKLTDKFVGEIDNLTSVKEKEVMEV